ncbi:MAG: hypothetical protein HOQ05_12545 [Corynebacteriales bacterium]|nr:hypothetical protein [Mycobacteriales bacterium]
MDPHAHELTETSEPVTMPHEAARDALEALTSAAAALKIADKRRADRIRDAHAAGYSDEEIAQAAQTSLMKVRDTLNPTSRRRGYSVVRPEEPPALIALKVLWDDPRPSPPPLIRACRCIEESCSCTRGIIATKAALVSLVAQHHIEMDENARPTQNGWTRLARLVYGVDPDAISYAIFPEEVWQQGRLGKWWAQWRYKPDHMPMLAIRESDNSAMVYLAPSRALRAEPAQPGSKKQRPAYKFLFRHGLVIPKIPPRLRHAAQACVSGGLGVPVGVTSPTGSLPAVLPIPAPANGVHPVRPPTAIDPCRVGERVGTVRLDPEWIERIMVLPDDAPISPAVTMPTSAPPIPN